MIKILSSNELKEADAKTILNEPITSIDLMERASSKFVEQFEVQFFNTKNSIYIFCGFGNNGGDGLSIARLLAEKKYKVFCFYFEGKYSNEFMTNFDRLSIPKYKIISLADFPIIDKNAIILDAIFGSGLNSKINGIIADCIKFLNQQEAIKISVDVPSGLYIDKKLDNDSIVFIADFCYTFHSPKLSFLLPYSKHYLQYFFILDISLNQDFISKIKTNKYYIDICYIKNIIKKRNKFSHKGTFGHALIVAGSIGKAGACTLAAKACMRTGVGLLTVHLPKHNLNILQQSFPEAMCVTDLNEEYISTISNSVAYDAIGIGCGIGNNEITQQAIANFLKINQCNKLLLDADAINILSNNKSLIDKLPENTILTPHVKEFERLVGKWNDDFERLQLQINFSKKYKIILVLKGAHTSISDADGNVYFNSTGNAGMATAGSGDVLSGIITSLLAQKYQPIDAAILGVYLHGLSGDEALNTQSEQSIIASDIIENIGNAYNKIMMIEC